LSYLAKKRLFYYKHLKIDIWGLVRNNLQYKVDRAPYNVSNLFYEAKLTGRLGLLKKPYYKWNKFIVYNSIFTSKKKTFVLHSQFIFQSRVKSIFYFYLLFYFFKTTIKNRLYNIYKAFFLNKKKLYQKRYYSTPFIYEPRIRFIPYRRHKVDPRHLSFQLVRLFYVIYSYNQLNRLVKKAKRLDDVFENKFVLLMECKLPSFVYRSSFFSNMFESISFIKNGGVWINKEMAFNLYYVIKVMDFVGFYNFFKGFIFWSFFKRIRRKAFLFLCPKYMYISFTFLFIILVRLPLMREMINPIGADAYKISNYI
jgi:hypothetical protein